MANKNELLSAEEIGRDLPFDLDAFEAELERQIEDGLGDLDELKLAEKNIGNTEYLGNVVMNVVWDQFMGQIGQVAGEEFIQENRNLTLDLRKDSHIQTTENFTEGKIASHNSKIDYQERYDDWQDNFQRNPDGSIHTHKTRTGKQEATLKSGARKPFDKGRPSGSAENHTDMDHTVSAGEIIRDSSANAHLSKEEQLKLANSEANLNEMNSSLNRSKGDLKTNDWLDNPNARGQKPNEIFDIDEDLDKQLRQKDAEAREAYEKVKAEGEKKSKQAGKESRREEATLIGKKALRAAAMRLLSELIKEVFQKLVQWLRSAEKSVSTLVSSIKNAITSFVSKLKTHLVNVTTTVAQTILSAIVGPVASTITKAITFMKQGFRSLQEAIAYVKDPANQGKSLDVMTMEIGKIVIAGVTALGGIVLGEVIEKGLLTIPALAVEIPLIGSLANLLGLFLGALLAGVVGAIALNFIDKLLEKRKRQIVTEQADKKRDEILGNQEALLVVKEKQLQNTKEKTLFAIHKRHKEASEFVTQSSQNIKGWNVKKILETNETTESSDDFKEMDKLLNGILDGKHGEGVK